MNSTTDKAGKYIATPSNEIKVENKKIRVVKIFQDFTDCLDEGTHLYSFTNLFLLYIYVLESQSNIAYNYAICWLRVMLLVQVKVKTSINFCTNKQYK